MKYIKCGEPGADTTLTETLVNMGVDELPVAPPMVLKVREKAGNVVIFYGFLFEGLPY